MPVFRPMQPVLHEQYATGASGGFAGGGTGALAQPNPNRQVEGAGENQLPNPLIADESTTAFIRAMKMAGLNPGSPSPAITKLLGKKSQLIQELMLQIGNSQNFDAVPSAPDLLNMLAGLIRSAMTGGKVFGGAGKEGALKNLMDLVNKSGTGTTGSVGGDILAAILGNPDSASNLFQEARYGNLAEPFQRAAARPLLDILDAFTQGQVNNPGQTPNFLATLLGGRPGSLVGPGEGMLPSGIGAPATGGATAGAGAPTGGAGLPQQPISPAAAAAGGAFPGYGLPAAPSGFLPPPNPLLGAPPTDPTAQLNALAQGGANPYLGY